MNYYNPYFSGMPYAAAASTAGKGILGGLTAGRGFSFSGLISGTQKTLGLINQAIPVIKQVSPVLRNAKTMFHVMNEFKKVDTPTTPVKKTTSNENYEFINSQSNINAQSSTAENEFAPTFFL